MIQLVILSLATNSTLACFYRLGDRSQTETAGGGFSGTGPIQRNYIQQAFCIRCQIYSSDQTSSRMVQGHDSQLPRVPGKAAGFIIILRLLTVTKNAWNVTNIVGDIIVRIIITIIIIIIIHVLIISLLLFQRHIDA